MTFSEHDSRSIEVAYQRLADEYDDPSNDLRSRGEDDANGSQSPPASGKNTNTSINEAGNDENAGGKVCIPVQEDYLFDVDILERELAPVYWLGPVGIWGITISFPTSLMISLGRDDTISLKPTSSKC